MNPRVLAGIDDQAKTAFPGLRSVLVVRGGELVVERYYHGSTATDYHNVFSVTKSVTSALVGIAWATTASRTCTRPSASCSPNNCPPLPILPWPR